MIETIITKEFLPVNLKPIMWKMYLNAPTTKAKIEMGGASGFLREGYERWYYPKPDHTPHNIFCQEFYKEETYD